MKANTQQTNKQALIKHQLIKPCGYALILMTASLSAHAQTCYHDILPTRPDSRYTLLANGAEVKDKVTGLIWQRCSLGQTWDGNSCSGTAKEYRWQAALTAAKAVGNGYRLPNIRELHSLTERQCHSPAINANIFPNTPSNVFFSSSPHVYSKSNFVWSVNFDKGNDHIILWLSSSKNSSYYVRAVRSE